MSRKRPLEDSSHVLSVRDYYSQSFPVAHITRWLYPSLPRLEIALWYCSGAVSRWRTFYNEGDLKKMLVEEGPVRIEIGAEYAGDPTEDRNEGVPVSRQLVFDVDVPDFDDLRACKDEHPGASTCSKCWKLIDVATRILDSLLRGMGFKHLLWVYSGNKGVHCWVCDPRACALDDRKREYLCNYLQTPQDHPVLDEMFPTIQREQGLVETDPKVIWPRLDLHVSTQTKHLLKSPFCVHPKTGRICVPFDPEVGFDPTEGPTLSNLDLDPYLEFFDDFLEELNRATPSKNPCSFGT